MIPIDRYIKTAKKILRDNPEMSIQTLAAELKKQVKRPTKALGKMDVGFNFYLQIATMVSRQMRAASLRDKLL